MSHINFFLLAPANKARRKQTRKNHNFHNESMPMSCKMCFIMNEREKKKTVGENVIKRVLQIVYCREVNCAAKKMLHNSFYMKKIRKRKREN